VSRQRLTERAGIAALAGFLVLDVVLVAAAFRSAGPVAASPGVRVATGPAETVSSPAPTPRARPAAPSSTTSVPTRQALPKPAPLRVGLVAVDRETAWRFVVGNCAEGGASLAVTQDGGNTWQPRQAPFDATVRIRVRDNGSAFAIGADQDCAEMIRQAEGAAARWLGASPVADAWYRDLGDAQSVGTPSGESAQPCQELDVVDLSVASTGAAVLCADGQVRTTTTGAEWETTAKAPGALAVALREEGGVLVALGLESCAGVAIAEASSPDRPLGCAASGGPVAAGTVSLSVTPSTAWLAAGSQVFRSSGDLGTWAKTG
jgi:hypothetical protein